MEGWKGKRRRMITCSKPGDARMNVGFILRRTTDAETILTRDDESSSMERRLIK